MHYHNGKHFKGKGDNLSNILIFVDSKNNNLSNFLKFIKTKMMNMYTEQKYFLLIYAEILSWWTHDGAMNFIMLKFMNDSNETENNNTPP